MTERCRNYVWEGYHSHQCARDATVERDGKAYCWQHDPEYVAKKDAERNAQWKRKWALDKKKRDEASRMRGLRKASSEMLGMFIKEIDVLTPAKLRAVRRVRHILGGYDD